MILYLSIKGFCYSFKLCFKSRTNLFPLFILLLKEAFTRVLMGNIEISRTIFPAGTKGKTVSFFAWSTTCFSPPQDIYMSSDVLTDLRGTSKACSSSVLFFQGINMEMLGRRALWEVGLNYGHGTGHGVGNYFGVHECKPSALICFHTW